MEDKLQWQWRPKRWWIGLLIFWLIAGGGAGIMARGGSGSTSPAFVTAAMLLFIIFASFTDYRGWSVLTRIGWAFGLLLMHAPVSFTFSLIFLFVAVSVGAKPLIDNPANPFLLDTAANLFAASPFVIWAMRRSKSFVEQFEEKDPK